MAGKEKKKKGKNKFSKIGSALMPGAMFAAVPRTPSPSREATSRPASVAGSSRPPSALSTAILNTTLVGRMIGTPPPKDHRGESLDRELTTDNSMGRSSMYDYGDEEDDDEDEEDNTDQRYSTVPIVRQSDKRGTISGRPRLDTPTLSDLSDDDDDGAEEVKDNISPSNIKESSQAKQSTVEEPIYALPNKIPVRKISEESVSSSLTQVSPADDFSDLQTPPPPWKKPRGKKGRESPQTEEDLSSLAVSDLRSSQGATDMASKVVEQPITETVVKQALTGASHTPSRKKRTEEFGEFLAQQQVGSSSQVLEEELKHVKQEQQQLLQTLQQQQQQLRQSQEMQRRQEEELKKTREYQKQERIMADEEHRKKQTRDEFQREIVRINDLCEELHTENVAIRKVNEQLHIENHTLKTKASRSSQQDDTSVQFLKQQLEDYTKEIDMHKVTVHKLSIELSRYQAKYRPLEKGDPPGLPSRGSSPRWLTDTRYLSPLILAYEDRLTEKDNTIMTYQKELKEIKENVEQVLHENQMLHLQLEETEQPSQVTMMEWHKLQEQAKLVLEENQLLMEQMDIQHEKQQQVHKQHSQEVSKLSKRMVMVDREKNELDAQLSELRVKYHALKHQHETLVVINEGKMPLEEHISTVGELQKAIEELKSKQRLEIENTLSKLSSVEAEKKNLAIRIADVEAEKTQMEAEIRALHRDKRKSQQKVVLLQKQVEHSESQETAANQHLNKVLQIAEQTAAERDAYHRMAKSQEHEKKKAVNKVMKGNVAVGRMEEKLKYYKMKADEKLGSMSRRMEDEMTTHVNQKEQYHREIRHLQQLLKDKQSALDSMTDEKRRVEEDLETVWDTVNKDNKHMKQTLKSQNKRSFKLDGPAFEYDSEKGLLNDSGSDDY
ncbi:centrosomal protein of 89 kDa-like isoform X2 [Anneissia japonica]|uniref:centrosomal protein of 89 kDa-like isoform X1 n=1 Tax=Anneissia japonica TaxID=1529436 RepID=UPI0014258339|nr:centrosomal protein of 89 kDa-like isoform X1 [Anneissia japonica]XP_033112273.1 centrosomal protein of 89 kDa-like isoform X2 [Anneissia japonica]